MTSNYPSAVWKHCPYCGSAEINWGNGTHCMLCATCGHNFFINAAAAVVALIVDNQGRYLFTRRRNEPFKNTLDLPGGFVNLNETAEDAVKREVAEELNIEITGLRYFGSFHNRYLYNGIVYFTLDIAFLCEVNNFTTLKAADDICAYEFIKPNDIDVEKIGLESIKIIAGKIKTMI